MIRSQIQIICAFIVFKTGGIIKLTHLQFRAWKHNKGLCRTIVAKLASLFYRIYFLLSFGAWLDGEGRTGSRIHWHYILWKGLSVTDSFCMIVLVNPTFIVYSHQSSGQGNYKSRGQNNSLVVLVSSEWNKKPKPSGYAETHSQMFFFCGTIP